MPSSSLRLVRMRLKARGVSVCVRMCVWVVDDPIEAGNGQAFIEDLSAELGMEIQVVNQHLEGALGGSCRRHHAFLPRLSPRGASPLLNPHHAINVGQRLHSLN